MVNSLDRYTIPVACNAGHYCVERIETYDSFKPLMAMEFPIEHAFCQGCLTRPFREFRFGAAIFTGRYCIARRKSAMIYKYKCQRRRGAK